MSVERQRLLEKWNLVRALIPAQASALQVQDMKRAFYAGATAFYGIVMNDLPPGDPNVVTEADLDVMAELHNELRAYQKRVEQGIE